MASDSTGREVMVFEVKRMPYESQRMYPKGSRRKVKKWIFPPVGTRDHCKRRYPYSANTPKRMAEWLVTEVGKSGMFEIRDWVPNKKKFAKYKSKLNMLARMKIVMHSDGSHGFSMMNSKGVARHPWWREGRKNPGVDVPDEL